MVLAAVAAAVVFWALTATFISLTSAFVASAWFIPVMLFAASVVVPQLAALDHPIPSPLQLTQPWVDFFRELEEMIEGPVAPQEPGQEWEWVGER